jgi:Tfp pilus assembly protein PilO
MSRKYFILGIFLIATGLTVYFMVLPGYRDITAIRESIAGIKEQIRQKEELKVALAQIQDMVSKNSEKLNFVDLVIPTGPKPEELFVIMDGLTQDNQIFLPSVKLSEKKSVQAKVRAAPKTKAGAATTPAEETQTAVVLSQVIISLNIEASYDNLKAFVNSIERSRRLFDIIDLQLKPPAEEGGPLDVSLKLVAYYK